MIIFQLIPFFLCTDSLNIDEWMESSGEDSSNDEDDNDDDDDENKRKKKKGKKAVKPKKKRKNASDDEAVEESDDGDDEGREVDYISSSGDERYLFFIFHKLNYNYDCTAEKEQGDSFTTLTS